MRKKLAKSIKFLSTDINQSINRYILRPDLKDDKMTGSLFRFK